MGDCFFVVYQRLQRQETMAVAEGEKAFLSELAQYVEGNLPPPGTDPWSAAWLFRLQCVLLTTWVGVAEYRKVFLGARGVRGVCGLACFVEGLVCLRQTRCELGRDSISGLVQQPGPGRFRAGAG